MLINQISIFIFFKRNKRDPLDIIQHIFDFLKRVEKLACYIRVDKDGSLSQYCELEMFLIHNQVQIETTSGKASKLNRMIERPNRECYVKTRSGLGLRLKFHKDHQHFNHQITTLIKFRAWRTGSNSILFYEQCNYAFDYCEVRILAGKEIGARGIRKNQSAKEIFLSSSEMEVSILLLLLYYHHKQLVSWSIVQF